VREWFGADGQWDSEYWSFDVVCQVFVLLACSTTFDVLRDLAPGTRPEVFSVDASDCFISSRMAIDGAFVPYIH
jgi:hypothetical protein